MNRSKIVFEIARWEFMRWFKIKGQLMTLIVSIVAGLVFAAGGYILEQKDKARVNIVVLNDEVLPLQTPANSRFTISPAAGKTEADLRIAVGKREIDGLLIISSVDEAELVVAKTPRWKRELDQILTSERQRIKMATMSISADQLIDVMVPFKTTVVYDQAGQKPSTTAERIAAGMLIAFMLVGIFYSLGGQLVSITGEKQLRVTEQILSAVSPQQWVDGKILGVSLFAAVQTFVFAMSTLSFVMVMQVFGQRISIPIEFSNPWVILVLIFSSVGGFFFWNTFLAAISSTINDPNSSSRTSLLFLPLMPSVIGALIAFKQPTSVLSLIVTLLPITSPVVLPVRLVLSEVTLWEAALALALLILCTWYMRIVAGKIFRVGMLMYGKEPGLKEMLRWLKSA
jgi:ABC-2 type transport system permease protein